MNFLLGKPFPSFKEWFEPIGQATGKTLENQSFEYIKSYEFTYLKDKLAFREGCIHEAIELLQANLASEEDCNSFEEWCNNSNGKVLCMDLLAWHKWVAFLLESSLGGNEE